MKLLSYSLFPSILLFASLLFFGHCACDGYDSGTETLCTSANTVAVPQDMKDRFFFKTGTWWVYENIISTEMDSFWVATFTEGPISVNDKNYGNIKDKCYGSFQVSIKALNYPQYNYYNNYSITLYPQDGHNLKNELFGLKEFTPINAFDGIYRFENQGGNYTNQMGASIEFLDSVVTGNGQVYRDILRIYYPSGSKTYDYLLDMYYARHIGLVKFHRRADNSHWELVRYHIKQ